MYPVKVIYFSGKQRIFLFAAEMVYGTLIFTKQTV